MYMFTWKVRHFMHIFVSKCGPMHPLEKRSHIANIANAVFGFICVVIGSIGLYLQFQQRQSKPEVGVNMPSVTSLALLLLILIGFVMLTIALLSLRKKEPPPTQSAAAVPLASPQPPISQKQEM